MTVGGRYGKLKVNTGAIQQYSKINSEKPWLYDIDWASSISPPSLTKCIKEITVFYGFNETSRITGKCMKDPGCYGKYPSMTIKPIEAEDDKAPITVEICEGQNVVYFKFKDMGEFKLLLRDNLPKCNSKPMLAKIAELPPWAITFIVIGSILSLVLGICICCKWGICAKKDDSDEDAAKDEASDEPADSGVDEIRTEDEENYSEDNYSSPARSATYESQGYSGRSQSGGSYYDEDSRRSEGRRTGHHHHHESDAREAMRVRSHGHHHGHRDHHKGGHHQKHGHHHRRR